LLKKRQWAKKKNLEKVQKKKEMTGKPVWKSFYKQKGKELERRRKDGTKVRESPGKEGRCREVKSL